MHLHSHLRERTPVATVICAICVNRHYFSIQARRVPLEEKGRAGYFPQLLVNVSSEMREINRKRRQRCSEQSRRSDFLFREISVILYSIEQISDPRSYKTLVNNARTFHIGSDPPQVVRVISWARARRKKRKTMRQYIVPSLMQRAHSFSSGGLCVSATFFGRLLPLRSATRSSTRFTPLAVRLINSADCRRMARSHSVADGRG